MPPFLAVALIVAQPEAEFACGLALRDDARAARPHFIEAAKGFDTAWQAGDHSPALAANCGRAHALAGDLPGAILAVRAGLAETPSDADLLRQLETHRDAVPYPPGTRPDRPAGWRTRLSGWDLFAVAGVAVLLVVVGVARRFTVRDGWALPLAGVGVAVLLLAGVAGWMLHAEGETEASNPVLVLIRPTKLRKGNGDTYPVRLDANLPRGAEVRERHRRGGWVQVELPNGLTGWLPETDTIR